jgi:hypothetical protein
MPMSEVGEHEDRRLQAVGEVEGHAQNSNAFVRILGQQHHVLRIAVRGVRAREEIRLLRARGHAGGGARALHVHDHAGISAKYASR